MPAVSHSAPATFARRQPVSIKQEDFIQSVASLPSTMPLIDAVSAMRQQRSQLALVRDDNGTVVGMISLEDILEQILGEFNDESDQESARAS